MIAEHIGFRAKTGCLAPEHPCIGSLRLISGFRTKATLARL